MKEDTEEPIDNFLIDDSIITDSTWDLSTWISGTTFSVIPTGTLSVTSTSTDTITFTGDTWTSITRNDPYYELEEIRKEQEDDEKLREEYPCLQEAYDNYLLIRKLLQDEECDKYFEDRMRVFKK